MGRTFAGRVSYGLVGVSAMAAAVVMAAPTASADVVGGGITVIGTQFHVGNTYDTNWIVPTAGQVTFDTSFVSPNGQISGPCLWTKATVATGGDSYKHVIPFIPMEAGTYTITAKDSTGATFGTVTVPVTLAFTGPGLGPIPFAYRTNAYFGNGCPGTTTTTNGGATSPGTGSSGS